MKTKVAYFNPQKYSYVIINIQKKNVMGAIYSMKYPMTRFTPTYDILFFLNFM